MQQYQFSSEDSTKACAVLNLEHLVFKIFEQTQTDKKTLTERCLKLCEEVGELAQSVLSAQSVHCCGYKQKTRQDIVNECTDVIVVAFSLLAHAHSHTRSLTLDEYENFLASLAQALNKWSDKCACPDNKQEQK